MLTEKMRDGHRHSNIYLVECDEHSRVAELLMQRRQESIARNFENMQVNEHLTLGDVRIDENGNGSFAFTKTYVGENATLTCVFDVQVIALGEVKNQIVYLGDSL
jgi:hypothetical protein